MAFTSQITGSPFTTPQANISAMAYTNVGGVKRIYYASGSDFTKIFCMQTNGTADISREINVQNQGDARTSPIRGLCSDGTYLYAITGALGNQYIHVYRLSDRTYRANTPLGFHADHYARGIETFPRPGRTTEKRIDILQDNIVRSYAAVVTASSITLSQQNDGTFALPTNEMVTSGNWQSIAWDDTTERLLIVAEQQVPTPGAPGAFTDRDKVFGFSYTGARDDREDFLPGIDGDAMTYNGDDDDLYMVHETSTNLYAWGDFPRWKLGNTDLNITEGVTYTLDLKPLVDTGATIAFHPEPSGGFYDNLSLGGNGVLTWSNPPAPQGGATRQPAPVTVRATLGSNVTDQTLNFVVNAANQPSVAPVWSSAAFPRQVVYEPYTPPAGAPTPNIHHQFQIHLTDYVQAGTPPFNFSVRTDGSDFPGTATIGTRYVNQQPIRDVLTFNASAVAASQLNRYLVVTVGNDDHPNNSTQNLPFEVINLMYPSWDQSSTTFSISDTGSHSFNLRDISTGEPQTDIEIVGSPPADLNAHITNGVLTTRAASLGVGGPKTEHITATLKNILTTTAGVTQQLTFNIASMMLPDSPPVWLPGTFTFRANRGQTQRIDLNQYIQSAQPAPTFSVSAPHGVLGQIEGSIEGQHFFEFTIPNNITENLNVTVDITATNRADASVKTFNVQGIYVASPSWDSSNIPQQTVRAGQVWELDLKPYLSGSPTPTIEWNPQPSGGNDNGANATLVNGVIRWEAPDDITGSQIVQFGVLGRNTAGTSPLNLAVHVNNLQAPTWRDGPIKFSVVEGELTRIPLDGYISGNPTPTLHLGSDVSDIPGPNSIRFDGLTMIVEANIAVISTLAFKFDVIGHSTVADATKQIEVDVTPIFVDNNEITLTTEDYEEIRKLVDTNLTIQELPDEIIAGDTVVGGAIAWAVDRMPVVDGNPRNLEEIKNKRRAILYRAAGCLAASVRRDPAPQLTGLQQDEFQLSTFLFMKAESMAELANKRLAAMGLLPSDTILGTDFIFRVIE